MRKLGTLLACSCLVLLAVLCIGCEGEPAQPGKKAEPTSEPERQDGMTAVEIMQKMVAVYREADSYLDNAEYAEHFILPEDGVKRQTPPTTFAVRLQRPNRFLITRLRTMMDGPPQGALVGSDGTTLEAVVTQLEPQRLRVDAPEVATLKTVAPDPVLREALFPGPIPDVFPQLALLLSEEEQAPWPLEAPRALVLLPPKKLDSSSKEAAECYRVQLRTDQGPQVCWIHKETFVLLRIEIANKKMQKHLYPNQEFTEFTWQFNFYDVAIDVETTKEMFRLAPAEDGQEEIVEAFREPETQPESPPEESSADPQEETEPSEQAEPPAADEQPTGEESTADSTDQVSDAEADQ
ncbi:hypothetical protein NG895_02700 [Aeoliella sp. ICT_H6.2]|uniref:Outer membrane lipoprotein-sorting protein n=1 Tax=Aeoliella straminimaris TaxID=2954799 RepID=A0A9X2JF18_9BACT|nr:hypothetical protein [Aeoliella straminimaris]MCO6042807.1 hypothetical protein [Aeoliella straminimaris]